MTRSTPGQHEGSGPRGTGPTAVYFAKAPRPGLVKTRLSPPLTLAEAAALYAAWLREVVRIVSGADTIIYGWPEDGLPDLAPYVPPGAELRLQRGAGLWERVGNCFGDLFAERRGPVAIRNTDSPLVGPDRVAEGLDRAAPGRVVLGPDAGGGFYLVALAEPCPGLFDGLDEDAATVFEAVAARARGFGLEVVELPRERDVDDFDDLLALWNARLANEELA